MGACVDLRNRSKIARCAVSASRARPLSFSPQSWVPVDVLFSDIAGVTDIAWVIVAFLAGLAARAGKLPPLVGYLAAGMGLAALGVEGGAVVDRIGELGVALLLFIVGLELRWKSLQQWDVLGAGSLHILVVSALGFGGGLLLGLPWVGAAAVGVSLSASSLVLAAKTLEARGDRRSHHGRIVIGVILLQTVGATAATAAVGASTPSLWSLGLLGLPLLRPGLKWLLDRVGRGELLLLLGLALAAGGSLLFSALNLGAELGALVAGALLAGHERTEELQETLNPLKNAFLPAFFLSVGLVGVPSGAGLAVVALLLVGLALKSGLLYGIWMAARMKARTAWMATLPLATYSGFTLIVGSAAVQAGALPESALTVLALATAGSYLINAPIARAADGLWMRLKSGLTRFERSNVPSRPDRGSSPFDLANTQFLIVGMGRSGTAAYDYLEDFLRCPVGLDDDPRRIERHREDGRRMLFGDARDDTLWSELDLSSVDVVLLTMGSLETKLESVRALREAGYEGAISALTAHPEHRSILNEAGANTVYLSIEQTGRALAAHGLKRRGDSAPTAVTLNVGPERLAA